MKPQLTSQIVDGVSSIYTQPLSISITETDGVFPKKPIEWLEEASIVSSVEATKVTIELTDASNTEIVAELDYYVFPETSVGYIHWLSVSDSIQEQNMEIATTLQQYVVKYLLNDESMDDLYVYPTIEQDVHIATETGFTLDSTVTTGVVPWYSQTK